MPDTLNKLIQSTPSLWKGSLSGATPSQSLSTGFEVLDSALPTAGWPLGAAIEIIPIAVGIGELRLMLPSIRQATKDQHYVLIINIPYIPYAPALLQAGVDLNYLLLIRPPNQSDAWWAAEKALRNQACKMVLLWSDGLKKKNKHSINDTIIRRLQMAARIGNSLLVLYRCIDQDKKKGLNQSPWTAARLKLSAIGEDSLQVKILKATGTHRRPCVQLNFNESQGE